MLVAGAFGLLGAVLSIVYYSSPRLRSEPVVHLLTVLVMGLSGTLIAVGASIEFTSFVITHRGTQFLLFFGASLFYVPVVVYLIVHYWQLLLERVTSPGSATEAPPRPNTQREEWQRIQACLEELAIDPSSSSAHERLGDIYAGMGFYDSAVYQYKKAADWLETGYGQSHMFYKTAWILIEKKKDIPAALSLLRRLERVYPRSYFASYARRVLSHYEAHNPPPRKKNAHADGAPPTEPHEYFFPPGEAEEN